MEKPGQFLVTKQLYRQLLPLLATRFMRFVEKHGGNREGFVMELKRLNVLDDPEMQSITDGYFLSKVPALIWLIEWTLTYEMRQVYEVYGTTPDFPYVIIHPYKFIGHLFQIIAGQWLMSNGAEKTVHDMDKFLKICLQEHLERNVPIVPHNVAGPIDRTIRDGRSKMLELHQSLWSEFPDLRPYIRYHEKWFQQQQADVPNNHNHNNHLGKDIKLLNKAITDLSLALTSKKESAPIPAPAPVLPIAVPVPVATPPVVVKEQQPQKRERERERRRRQQVSSSDDDDDDNEPLPEAKNKTIRAKLNSDDEKSSSSGSRSSSSSDSEG